MVPDISVTVLAFSACFVLVDPNWKIALRLSLTFAGSNSVSSTRAVSAQAIIMANIAIPTKRRMVSPRCEKLVLYLSKSLLRSRRTELRRLLVPGTRHGRIGSDASRIRRTKHGWIIGLGQQQRGAGFLRIRGPFEQQSGSGDVPDRNQAVGPRQQGCEFVGIEPSWRRSFGYWLTDFRLGLMRASKCRRNFVARRGAGGG